MDWRTQFGVGGEYLYADGFVRTSLSAGPSILLTGTDLDEPGQTGVFFEIRPTGLRWHQKMTVIGVDPILRHWPFPFLKAFPIELEYRTTIRRVRILKRKVLTGLTTLFVALMPTGQVSAHSQRFD